MKNTENIESKINSLIEESTVILESKTITENKDSDETVAPTTDDVNKVADKNAPEMGVTGNPTMDGHITEPTHIPSGLLKAAGDLADS